MGYLFLFIFLLRILVLLILPQKLIYVKYKYYIVDIIGLKVFSEDGEEIGEVTDVFRTGSNDVFEVKRQGGKKAYIPHIDDIVKNIDLDSGITIHVMEGLLDED